MLAVCKPEMVLGERNGRTHSVSTERDPHGLELQEAASVQGAGLRLCPSEPLWVCGLIHWATAQPRRPRDFPGQAWGVSWPSPCSAGRPGSGHATPHPPHASVSSSKFAFFPRAPLTFYGFLHISQLSQSKTELVLSHQPHF